MLEEILDRYPNYKIMSADGLDDAILGIDEKSMRLIYSVEKCIEIFMRDGMTYDEASEFFEYNTRGSYVGKKTPIWCD